MSAPTKSSIRATGLIVLVLANHKRLVTPSSPTAELIQVNGRTHVPQPGG